jgi:phage-related holin
MFYSCTLLVVDFITDLLVEEVEKEIGGRKVFSLGGEKR